MQVDIVTIIVDVVVVMTNNDYSAIIATSLLTVHY